jgi:hypothetical protein
MVGVSSGSSTGGVVEVAGVGSGAGAGAGVVSGGTVVPVVMDSYSTLISSTRVSLEGALRYVGAASLSGISSMVGDGMGVVGA